MNRRGFLGALAALPVAAPILARQPGEFVLSARPFASGGYVSGLNRSGPIAELGLVVDSQQVKSAIADLEHLHRMAKVAAGFPDISLEQEANLIDVAKRTGEPYRDVVKRFNAMREPYFVPNRLFGATVNSDGDAV